MKEDLVDRKLVLEIAKELGEMFAVYSLEILELCQTLSFEEAQERHANGAMNDQEFQQLKRYKEVNLILQFANNFRLLESKSSKIT